MSLLAFYFIGDSVFGPLRQRYEFPPERTTACREQRPPVRRLYGTQPGLKRLLRPGCVEKGNGGAATLRFVPAIRPSRCFISGIPGAVFRLPASGLRPGTPFGEFGRTPGPAVRRGSDDDVDDFARYDNHLLGRLAVEPLLRLGLGDHCGLDFGRRHRHGILLLEAQLAVD